MLPTGPAQTAAGNAGRAAQGVARRTLVTSWDGRTSIAEQAAPAQLGDETDNVRGGLFLGDPVGLAKHVGEL